MSGGTKSAGGQNLLRHRINRLMGLAQGKSCGPRLGVKKSGAILLPTQGRINYLALAYPGRTVSRQGDGVREAQFP